MLQSFTLIYVLFIIDCSASDFLPLIDFAIEGVKMAPVVTNTGAALKQAVLDAMQDRFIDKMNLQTYELLMRATLYNPRHKNKVLMNWNLATSWKLVQRDAMHNSGQGAEVEDAMESGSEIDLFMDSQKASGLWIIPTFHINNVLSTRDS